MEDDPLAAIKAMYHRHERHPMPRLTNALRDAGCRLAKSRTPAIEHEVVLDGMCIGFISKEGPVNVLELSKRETPPEVAASVAASIAASEQAARAGMRAQIGIVR